ncbi:MAG: ribosome biogenesis GTPase Der [bacterium]
MKPVVCIVGRPNVGKSTLFNRLVGQRLAIVQDDPGVTRDRLYGAADWDGEEFVLIDTGGLTPADPSLLSRAIQAQANVAIEEADAIVLVVDARAGVTTEDAEVARLLRQSGKEVLLAANKADGAKTELEAAEFYELGLGEVYAISAQHGRNTADLLDGLVEVLRRRAAPAETVPEEEERLKRVALVGRPNAGKSSLVNRLIGEQRMLVDAKPGTTRDPVDSLWEAAGERFQLMDTAGIRRKRSAALDMEKIAVLKAIRAIERSQLVCLLVDAAEGAKDQDAKIASLCDDEGRALVIVASKTDLVPVGSPAWKEMLETLQDKLRFVDYAPVIGLSSLAGTGLAKLPKTIQRVYGQWNRRITTSTLNQFLEEAVDAHHPAAHRGREVRLYYVTQVSTRPPTFVFSTNAPDGVRTAYRRYLRNRVREVFGFEGTPLRLLFRKRGKEK